MLDRVSRRSLPDAVFERISERIFEGTLAPGDALPSERELALQLGVNRNALREALKRLEQLRLVSIHPGGSTRVLDFRRSSGLDLLTAVLFTGSGELRLEAARSLVELRAVLGPDIAARAASRGGPGAAAQLTALLDGMRAIPLTDLVARQRQSLELWRVLVSASDNLAYRLAFNTMEQAWSKIGDLMAPALREELQDERGYDKLIRAVERGDATTARKAARQLCDSGEAGLMKVLKLAKQTLPRKGQGR
jgi:DNA-binding FadR family transcriptional regulator